jgi:CheY-like chemotaxis protein
MIGYGKRALVVDDTETMRLLLAEVLGQEGFAVVQACEGVQALCEMQRRHFDVVITDFHMPASMDSISSGNLKLPGLRFRSFSSRR